jgi:class 3 adenylate cyclase/tetratricopeptide (TPR) repeat protein
MSNRVPPALLSRAPAGQRRYATVLFSDVSDSSQHAEQLEAEEYAALLEKFRTFARDVIPRHGGSIARLQGDGVLALFGHQETREDDGRRATQAALELHAAVARLRINRKRGARSLQLHSGIHAGLVLLIEGDIERGRFDVVGEVPNTAARLCSLAAGGEILVSAETLGPHAHFFDVTPSRRTAIRGRSTPVDVVRVTGSARLERRIDAAARRGVVPIVGRSAPLESLLQTADRVAMAGRQEADGPSRAATVHISGEPGVGKTRLIDEFQSRLDRKAFQVMQGYCESYLGAEPLQPFMNGLRALLQWQEEAASPLGTAQVESIARQLLGVRHAAPDEAGSSRPAVPAMSGSARIAAIVELLTLIAGERTLVLILDDWQWADDASRETLHALLTKVRPLMVVLAARSGGLTDDPALIDAEHLLVQPLDAAAGEHAIHAWLPEADPFLVQEIYNRSGGSPLFIEELCHAAAAGGDLSAEPAVQGVAWINALVASRLARLPVELTECLQLASVIGNVVPIGLLQRVTHESAALLAQVLVDQDFLMPTAQAGTLRFKHALTRDAVYATVDPTQRRAWHLRVAQTLEASAGEQEAFESLEALSYHYDAAERSEQATTFAVAAGDRAFAAMALDRARAHYLTALRALDMLPALSRPNQLQWCVIAQKLAYTCVFDPLDMNESSRMFERAVQLAQQVGDINTLARAEYWMAYVNYGRGRPSDAVRYSEAALEHAEASSDLRLVSQVRATLGQSLASAGRYERALPLLADAVEGKRRQSRPGSGTAIGSVYCLARMGYTHGDQGNFDDAHACFEQALVMLGDAVHSVRASINELICAVHLWQGRWVEAREAGFAGADIALRCRSRYLTAMGRALGNCAVWAIDGDEPALRALRDATHWIDARGGAVSTSLNYGWLVEAAVTMGHAAEARQYAAGLVQRARLHDRHGHAMGCRALARMAVSHGKAAVARRYLDAADSSAAFRSSAREQAVNMMARAELALALRAPAEARARLDSAGEAFEKMRMHWHLQRARSLFAAL